MKFGLFFLAAATPFFVACDTYDIGGNLPYMIDQEGSLCNRLSEKLSPISIVSSLPNTVEGLYELEFLLHSCLRQIEETKEKGGLYDPICDEI